MLHSFMRDVRVTSRSLARAKGFAIMAIMMMAVGLGAITAIYSLVDHILLRPLRYPEAEQLVVARTRIAELAGAYPSTPVNASLLDGWRERCQLCASIAAIKPLSVTTQQASGTERLHALSVTASTFSLLGLKLEHGIPFDPVDDRIGQSAKVVLSDAYARRRFGSASNATNQVVSIDGRPSTVIGVLSTPTYLPVADQLGNLVPLPRQADVLLPLALGINDINAPGGFEYAVIMKSRTRDLTRLQRELDTIIQELPAGRRGGLTIAATVTPLADQILGPERTALWLQFGAVGILLLLLCVNLGCLLLARSDAHVREYAVRQALGAGTVQLIRLAVFEALALVGLGAGIGLVLARVSLSVILRTAPANIPRLSEVQLDWRVAGIAMSLAVLIAVVSAGMPTLLATSTEAVEVLRGGGHGITYGRRTKAYRKVLLGAQGALCTSLLLITGLFALSYARVLRVPKGFAAAGLAVVDIAAPTGAATIGRRVQAYEAIAADLRALPGVTHVAVASRVPLDGESDVNSVARVNDTRPPATRPVVNVRYVTREYFQAMRMPLVRGASFDASLDGAEREAVVSVRAAAALFGTTDVVGRSIVVGDDGAPSRIVGVSMDAPISRLEEEPVPIVYVPLARGVRDVASLVVRYGTPQPGPADELRRRIHDADAAIPVLRIRRGTDLVAEATQRRRFELMIIGIFAIAALVAASMGIVGIMNHVMARRTTELGIRCALGAGAGHLYRLVMRQELLPFGLGLLIGVLVAFTTALILKPLLFQVDPLEPGAVLFVVLLMLALGISACWVPARRVVSRSGLASLREE